MSDLLNYTLCLCKTGYLIACTVYSSISALVSLMLEGFNIFFLWSLSFDVQLTCWVLNLNLHPCSFHCHYYLPLQFKLRPERQFWLFSVLLRLVWCLWSSCLRFHSARITTAIVLSRKTYHFTPISLCVLGATYTYTYNFIISLCVWCMCECCHMLVDVTEQLFINYFLPLQIESSGWTQATWWAILLAQAQHLYSLFQTTHHTFL